MVNCDISTAPQLLLVTMENCLWAKLQNPISTLIWLGWLSWIVVDEAHLLAKHESFRPCEGMLSFFGRLPIMIVLTVMCLNALERCLFKKLGREVYKVPIQANRDFEETVAKKVMSMISFYLYLFSSWQPIQEAIEAWLSSLIKVGTIILLNPLLFLVHSPWGSV
jgi:hypothetical protein